MKYKGYKVGSVEKELLKLILNIKDRELPKKYSESFSDIFKTARQKYDYPITIRRMAQKGYINFIQKDGELKTILTSVGKKVAKSLFLQDFKQFKRPLIWDKKWRIVMFEVT